jgi:serine/threonine protein kinase
MARTVLSYFPRLAPRTSMSLAAQQHPTAASLKAYGQGRLTAREMSDIEIHLADCDSCCTALANLPDDTLLLRAREAATSGFRAREQTVAAPRANPREVPKALRDHPRYRVLGLLGAGGMGAVYKAEHRKMERMVALKVINPALVSSPAALERFEREVKAAAKLLHPNIVTAHDAEQAGDLHFLVMEFVEGASLDRLLDKMGPLSPQQAAHLIRQAATGLQHAHEKGMIHRDLKPQNLMVTRAGVLKILDFGLARLASQALLSTPDSPEEADRPADATRAGAVLGTPDYIAPEQATDAHKADIRADIYSLGCTLYFLLTGEPPFAGGSLTDKLHAHQTCEPTPIRLRRPEVPEELAAVLDKMLAKDPAARYARPIDVAKALEPFARSRALAPAASKATSSPAQTPAPTVAAEPEAGVLPLEIADLDAVIASALPLLSKAPSQAPKGRKSKVPPKVWGSVVALSIVCAGFLFVWLTGDKNDQKRTLATTPTIKNRLLMVLPLNNTYYPDYENIRAAIDQSPFKLETAALSIRPQGVGFLSGGQPPDARTLRPDKELKDVTANDYDAIIFIGGGAQELCGTNQGAADVRRLLQDFERQGKFVTSICAGQYVLAKHGRLTPDRKVAYSKYAHDFPGFAQYCRAEEKRERVEIDDHLITAADAWDGELLINALTEAIRKQPAPAK